MYFPELREGTIALMDLDERRLEVMLGLANKIKRDNDLAGLSFEPTTDRRRALSGADYVIASFEVGSQTCRRLDQEIPFKYGLRVCYSSGTQRVAQTLRQMPVTIAMCREMEELCPDALLLQYGNPVPDLIMGIAQATKVGAVGLCHSVQGTAKQIAGYIGVPFEELDYWCAGINHQAWYLRLERDGADLYPRLRQARDTPEVWAKDKVRFELLRYFGLFVTESSPHNADYVPYFHTHPELEPELDIPPFLYRDRWYKSQETLEARLRAMVDDPTPAKLDRSNEYGAELIHAIESDTPYRFAGNFVNNGLITNLPRNTCVEVPTRADGSGLHPCQVGDLPGQAAALNANFCAAAEFRVKAALTGDREAAYLGAQLDPLTAASVKLPDIRKLVDELIEAERDYIPQFKPGFTPLL
jgi:alpha-galactosidase